MKKIILGTFFCTLIFTAAYPDEKLSNQLNIIQIEQLTNAKGQLDTKENVFKVSVPRNDLTVTVNGVKLTPPMGLTSWAAFETSGNHTLVMGDLVMTEDQVNPVMSVALDNGLNVTALHNHFFWDNPKVMFMHIEGVGNEAQLATAIGKVLAKIKATSGGKSEIPTVNIDPANTNLNPHKIDAILGVKGTLKEGVYKVVFGRTAHMNGFTIGSSMGVNTWAAFAGSDDRAVVDGDVAMHESEMQNVLKTLRAAGINIVAIHQHMNNEQPRIMFLHYWGIGNTEDLSKALRKVLNETKND